MLEFGNKSGDARLDHWRDGLAVLLIAHLSQSKSIRVVPGDEMFTILKRLGLTDARKYSSEDIKKIAAQSRATHVLSGNFITAGDNFVITAGLQKPATSESPMTLLLEAKGDKAAAAAAYSRARDLDYNPFRALSSFIAALRRLAGGKNG